MPTVPRKPGCADLSALIVEPSSVARMQLARVCEELGFLARVDNSIASAMADAADDPPDAAIVARRCADYPGESLLAAWSCVETHASIPVAIVAQARLGVVGAHPLVRGATLADEARAFLQSALSPVAPARIESLHGIRVLVVDDMPAMRKLVSVMLSKAGAEVSVAGNGLEGFKILTDAADSLPFDLVVTDLEMPELDGLGLLDKIRERDDRIPVLANSAHDPDTLPDLARFDAVVEKARMAASLTEICLQVLGEHADTA